MIDSNGDQTTSVPAPFPPGSPVGFIGLGSMGSGMAACLQQKGWRVRVFARRRETAQALADAGMEVAPSMGWLGRNTRLVFMSLPDADAVEDVLFGGADPLADSLTTGSCVVDTSTIAASSARSFGERLRRRGCFLLDAPVSGGEGAAKAGTLACMVGGDAAVLDACREAMGAFCKTVTHLGPLGAGQTVKACNQVAVAGALLGVAEALALARAEGLDLHQVRNVLLGGTARSFSMETHAPRIINGQFAPGFRARLMRKDLRIALENGRGRNAALPATELAEQLLGRLCESGRGDWDWSALALEVQEPSGVPIGKAPPKA